MATKEQLELLKSQADKYGGYQSEEFKTKVNQIWWEWAYDKLTWKLQTQRDSLKKPVVETPQIISTPVNEQTIAQNKLLEQDRAKLNAERVASWDMKETPATNINIIPTPTPTPTTTETTPTETPTTDLSKIQTVEDWKKQTSGSLTDLESWIEARYNTVANQQDWKITSTIWNEMFEWSIDDAWNPIKTKVWTVWEAESKALAEKQLQEAKNPENIYKNLQAGVTITDPEILNSTEYKEAKQRYNQFTKYKDFNDKQFQTAFNEWLILPWTKLYSDLSTDPKIKLQMDKANALNKINGVKTSQDKVFETQSEEIWNNTDVEIDWETMTLSKALKDWFIDKDEYNALTNTSEVISKLEEVEDLKNEADRLQSIYDNIRTETENSLKWTGATVSDLESIVWEKQKNMLWNLNLSISKYNNALWTLTELKKTNSDLFATNLQLYWKAEDRAYNERMIQEDRAYKEQQATKQLEQQFDMNYWDINSTDERVQRVAFERIAQDLQKQYAWMPFRRTVSEMAMDFMNEFNSWKSISDISTETTQAIQNAPAYQNWAIWQWLATAPSMWAWVWAWIWEWTTSGWFTWNTLDFIKESEWYSAVTYDDMTWEVLTPWMTAQWTPTIWYWFINVAWQPVTAWMHITSSWDIIKNWQVISNVDTELQNQIAKHSNYANLVKVPLSEAQKTALTSFEYNLWPNIWSWTWKTIIDKINSWDLEWASREMKLYNQANWEFMQWLQNRRNKEAELLMQWDTTLTDTDIRTFNSTTFKPQSDLKTDEQRKAYSLFLEQKKWVMDDKDADIDDILNYSAWGRWITWEIVKPLQKFDGALSQLWDIQEQISKMETWPVIWTLKWLNPYDVDAQTLKAQLTALMPNLARWVYWEVWVLTDNDIRLYSQTIPNLKATKDVNNAILGMTLKVLANWYKKQLRTLAAANYDVSWFTWLYDSLMWQVNSIESDLWINTTPDSLFEEIYNW